MKSTAQPPPPASSSAALSSPAPHLVDEILEEVFLRLPTAAALARASTANRRFRSVITDRSFLRRFRKRHRPPLLGFAVKGGFHPAQAPHPSAPLGRALADAADFTYSFVPVPSSRPWFPRDLRDGRVLLERRHAGKIFKSFVVCDPLSRSFVLLPSIPHDMTSQEKGPSQIRPMLAPMGEHEQGEDETSFKVICFANYDTKLVAFIFSSGTQEWCVAASASWSSLGGRRHDYEYLPFSGCSCFYSASALVDWLIVLDTRTMEFSVIDDRTGYHVELRCLPGQAYIMRPDNTMQTRRRPGQSISAPGIAIDREGNLEMFSLVGDHSPNGSFHLHHTSQQKGSGSSKEWQLEKIIPLPGGYDYFTAGAAEGFLFLGATTEEQSDIDEDSSVPYWMTDWDVDYFSLQVKTSEVTKVCRSKRRFFHTEHALWYFGYPPSLSKPCI